MNLPLPELSLVLLIGASGSGKSTFAARHFQPTEVISSDRCRALVAGDENDLSATSDAFQLVHFLAGVRLKRGLTTVIDATNLHPEDRTVLVAIAREHHCLPVAVVLDQPERLLHERNRGRADRTLPDAVIHRHANDLRRWLRGLRGEGFHAVYLLHGEAEVEAARFERQRSWTNRRDERGPFDLIGDVHGCYDELLTLLEQLGYAPAASEQGPVVRHPEGRRAVLLGDLVDRGPRTPDVLRLAIASVAAGTMLVVPGNHDAKLLRALRGNRVQVSHGLAESLAQLAAEPPAFREQVIAFLDGLVGHFVLDGGNLVVAHAGMREEMQGRASRRCREFALFGETTGETDEFGLPVRYDWARDYRGRALVAYGHTPVPVPEWVNNTICLDTGCVFGGRLTALRYPERELVSVPAARTYYKPARPLQPPQGAQQDAPPPAAGRPHALPEIGDVLGKRQIATELAGNVTVRAENAAAALEVMSRFAVDPRWLIYLPPTMSPPETTRQPGLLEHPAEAFAYYRQEGVANVICEQKHMGSRAVVLVCRTAAAAEQRFGAAAPSAGICYTRTGRRFFADAALETELLRRVRSAAEASGLWDELATDVLCLDCELLPWSAKARDLLLQQYASTGAAARAALAQTLPALQQARDRGVDIAGLLERFRGRDEAVRLYVDAYRRYCWNVTSIDDLRLAPFHLLAGGHEVYNDRDHRWHMTALARLAHADTSALLLSTPYLRVDVTDRESEAEGVRWWEALTGAGGEGMVVKPLEFTVKGRRGLVQPGIKCRGAEYLRIIYGPEYLQPDNLERLRARSVGRKRALATREFAIGIEGLQRFVRGEPLYRVHECAFAVLALESEPVDPRL